MGNYVEVDHGNGVKTRYEHMSKRLCSVGDVVTAGEVLGRVGSAGTTHGGSRHDLAATIMTEDDKTEGNTAGSSCGAYIGMPCKFVACRAYYSANLVLSLLYHFLQL